MLKTSHSDLGIEHIKNNLIRIKKGYYYGEWEDEHIYEPHWNMLLGSGSWVQYEKTKELICEKHGTYLITQKYIDKFYECHWSLKFRKIIKIMLYSDRAKYTSIEIEYEGNSDIKPDLDLVDEMYDNDESAKKKECIKCKLMENR